MLHAWDYPTLISLSASPSTIASGAAGGNVTIYVNGIGLGDSAQVTLTVSSYKNYDMFNNPILHGGTTRTLTVNGFDRTFPINATAVTPPDIMTRIVITATCNGSSASVTIN